jgi:hypothetical protein
LSPGGVYSVSYIYEVTEDDVGVLTNCFTVTYNDDAGNVYTVTDCTDLTVEPLGTPFVTVTKSVSPTTATVGDIVDYLVVVANEGTLAVTVTELCDNRWSECLTISETLSPGGVYSVSYIYEVTEDDVGVLTNCFTVTYNDEAGNVYTVTDCTDLTVEPLNGDMDIDIDIKPGSFPNSLNVKSKGVLPVAILGTADFDVMAVDPSTVMLGWDGIHRVRGIPPLRWAWEDVNEDGWMDLVLKYSMEVMIPFTLTHEAPGDLIMTLTGNMMDGTPISGEDTVRIINKGYVAGP